jgi:hypothetical protein
LENVRRELEEIATHAKKDAGDLAQYRQSLGRLPERIMELLGGSGQGIDKQVARDYAAARSAVAAAEAALIQAHGDALRAAAEAQKAVQKERRR